MAHPFSYQDSTITQPGRVSSRGTTGGVSSSPSLGRSAAIFLGLSVLGLASAAGPEVLVTVVCVAVIVGLLLGGVFAILMGVHLEMAAGDEGVDGEGLS